MPRIHGEPSVSIWNGAARAGGPTGTAPILVALAFKFTAAGRINGYSFLLDPTDGGDHHAYLIHQLPDLTVRCIDACSFRRHLPPTGGSPTWQKQWVRPWIRVSVGDLYELVVYYDVGKYSTAINARVTDPDIVVGPITVPGAASGVNNGLTSTTLRLLPNTTIGNAKPAIDISFQPD